MREDTIILVLPSILLLTRNVDSIMALALALKRIDNELLRNRSQHNIPNTLRDRKAFQYSTTIKIKSLQTY